MLYKNMEIHNAAELITHPDGSISWLRVPSDIMNIMEMPNAKRMCKGSTGVELRFLMESDEVVFRLQAENSNILNTFHVCYGGLQGGWEDHELNKFVSDKPCDFVIKKPRNLPMMKKVSALSGDLWNPEVVRIIFDRGTYKLLDIDGDIKPPAKADTPPQTIMAYGSSITHGSNSIDASHAWVSLLGHNLSMDYRNLGMAGSCAMEPALIDYIAREGKNGNWDIAVLELGINVLGWDDTKIKERVHYAISEIAGENPLKPVFVVSPLYSSDDFNNAGKASNWRMLIAESAKEFQLPNVTVVDGLELINSMALISADEVHPNIYGVQQIAERMTERIKNTIAR